MNVSTLTHSDSSTTDTDFSLSNEDDSANKVVVFLGRTGSGKTSLFNLLSDSRQPVGNSISSTTKQFVCKTNHGTTFIDTIGFRDTEEETEHRLKVVLFLKEIRNGFDIIFYCIRMDVFTSDEANLFSEIYETVLTKKAYTNSCLLITFYTRSDLDEVNTLNSPERARLLNEFRQNRKYAEILDLFEDRVLFVEIKQEESLTDYPIGSTRYLQYATLNSIIVDRRQIVYEHLTKFIDCFFPERFDCENMETMRDLIWKNERLEKQLNELRGILNDITREKSTTGLYNLLQFMPISNMFIHVFETSRREKLEKRIAKVTQDQTE